MFGNVEYGIWKSGVEWDVKTSRCVIWICIWRGGKIGSGDRE